MKTLTISLQVFLVIVFSSFTIIDLSAQPTTIEISGDISQNTTWSDDTVKVTGDLTLLEGNTLTIEPGVFVEFQGYYEFRIFGEILAVGSENDPIYFTVDDTTDFYASLDDSTGCWKGIHFEGSGNSIFHYCNFSFAKAVGEYPDYKGGAMHIEGDAIHLSIRACIFENNYARSDGGAIQVSGIKNELTIDSCQFIWNTSDSCGGAINLQGNKYTLGNNEFGYNKSNCGGAVSFLSAEVNFYNNIVYRNTADDMGGGVYALLGTFTAVNNIISNNLARFGGGLYIDGSSYPQIINNLIVNNSASNNAGGICLAVSDAILTSNTIIYNAGPPKGGVGGCFIIGSFPVFQNCIIYFNEYYQIGLKTDFSVPNFYFSTIQGGTEGIAYSEFHGLAVNILTDDPEFESVQKGAGYIYDGLGKDWSLKPGSPCLNAGNPVMDGLNLPENDIYGRRRIANSIVEHGAAETYIDHITVSGNILYDEYWVADTVFVIGNTKVTDSITLTINSGTVVEFQDFYELMVYGSIVAKGKPGDTIIFTVPEEKRSTGWSGLYIYNGQAEVFFKDSSIIDMCIFEYAKATNDEKGGAIEIIWMSNLRVSNSVFRFDSSSVSGAAISAHYCSPLICNNLFTHNYAPGGVTDFDHGGPYFIGNNIIDNPSRGVYGSYVNIYMRDNFIANNSEGIYLCNSNTKPCIMVDNIIVNNDEGGVKCEGPDLYFVNNNIVHNGGNGIHFVGGQLTLLNSIFSGNDYNEIIENTKSIQIHNCLVMGGLTQLVDTTMPNLIMSHNVVGDPGFINPSQGMGRDYFSQAGDWGIYSVSPCINAGINSFGGFNFPSADILGNQRINLKTIDIGAVENQSEMLSIIKHPQNHIKCESEHITLYVNASDTARYQWLKDGVELEQENSKSLYIDSLSISDQGSYYCLVSNGYGTVESSQAYILVNEPARFLSKGQTEWVQSGNHVIIEPFFEGSNPEFIWEKDGKVIPGEFLPKLDLVPVDSTDEGIYVSIISNTCGTDTSEATYIYLASQICMVTVDPLTGNNLVIWEKETLAPLLEYNIYRESKAAGIYDLMGTVSHNDLSIFVDSTADPMVQAYLYKITGVDTSGYETDIDLCKPHKTIHLLVSTNPELNTTQLEWDKHYGFNYQTYHIYRSPTKSDFIQIHSLSSSLNSWTDPDPLIDVGYYRIAVEKPDPCYPTGGSKKADAGPYSHSMSNMEDNRLQAVQENQAPMDMNMTNNTIAENQSIGTLVGRLETTDADTADHHTYKLVSGSGDTDNNRFTTLGDLLITAEILDYETKDTLSVRVKSTDKGDLSFEEIFIILVTDVNEGAGNLAPTDIKLSFNYIDENKPVGTMIGKFQTTDPNGDDMHTYGLVEGLGGDDNTSFTIMGDMLISSAIFDYETQGQYSIRVRSKDDGDGRLSFEKSFTIYVNDLVETDIINHQIKNKGIDIYPNPFSERTTITFSNPDFQKYQLILMDLTGKVMRQVGDITGNKVELSRENLSPGLYMIELRGVDIYRGMVVVE